MLIAVVGCGHGELEKIYETALNLEKSRKLKLDLIIVSGDFQSVRSSHDLASMAVPQKFRKLRNFYKYYNGERTAPIFTIFVGGNHEASNYLQELPYGGFVAPNIYYMGHCGIVNFNGIRIAGISGIYNRYHHTSPRFEFPPYDDSSLRSVYHYRAWEVQRLAKNNSKVDVFVSHDWPASITSHGDLPGLLRKKPFFFPDISANKFGSPPLDLLLKDLKPSFWFAAHFHVHFTAHVQHSRAEDDQTYFLALDKCLPGRKFMEVVEVRSDYVGPPRLNYDREWLAILRKTDSMTLRDILNCGKMGDGEVDRLMGDLREEDYAIPVETQFPQSREYKFVPNGQNVKFCAKFGVCDPNEGHYWTDRAAINPDEIVLSD